jgi:molecular chaperone DnaJ
MPGPDMETSIDITLNDATTGVRRDVAITLPVSCSDCQGRGAAAGTSVEPCGECHGIGEVRRVKQSILGQMITSSACPRCSGVGTIVVTPCEICRGEGRTTVKQTLTLDVPAGVENGSTMRLSGRGPAGLRGGPNGTLFVHIRVTHDPRFERQGDDLHTQVVIGYLQAVLGTEIEIPTLEGPEVIDVPAASKHGTVLRLKGRGVTHLRGRGVGDLYVHISIDVPSDVSDAERDLLRQLAQLQGVPTNDESGNAKMFRRGKSK